ncbi:MAG: glycosyltransferase [Oscillospiraceae bacterium]|nr:glycosyltransferase [Oscillospiraceae bacterium]
MISVIIPTYNRVETIKRSIRSVLNQTYSDLECIVVDDGSTDNTADIVQSINDDRLRYYKLDHNSGACVARNKGIELAVGEYIAFQDSDDEWDSDKLRCQLQKLNMVDADVCICRKRVINEKTGATMFSHKGMDEGFISKKTLYKGTLSTQLLFAKSEVFKNICFDEKVKKFQDYEWGIRACELYTFYFIPDVLVTQFLQSDSITVRGWDDHEVDKDTFNYFIEKYENRYKKDKDLKIALLRHKIRSDTTSNVNSVDSCKEVFDLTLSARDLVILIAAKLGLLKLLYATKRRIDNSYWCCVFDCASK